MRHKRPSGGGAQGPSQSVLGPSSWKISSSKTSAQKTRSFSRKKVTTRKSSGVVPKEKLGNLLVWAKRELQILGKREAELSAQWLLADLMGMDRTQLYFRSSSPVLPGIQEKYLELVSKRKKRVPLAHLLGKVDFFEETLQIGPGCLIPRPETEILVEKLIENLSSRLDEAFSFLDLGCGSGAIGLSLLRKFPKSIVTFSDVSEEALCWTRKNVLKYGLEKRSVLKRSDLFLEMKEQVWDVIVSNPPYLSAQEWGEVEPEVLHDPPEALVGGISGFDFYERIAGEAGKHLTAEGMLALEIGRGQAPQIKTLLARHDFNLHKLIKDYAGIDRVILARRSL